MRPLSFITALLGFLDTRGPFSLFCLTNCWKGEGGEGKRNREGGGGGGKVIIDAVVGGCSLRCCSACGVFIPRSLPEQRLCPLLPPEKRRWFHVSSLPPNFLHFVLFQRPKWKREGLLIGPPPSYFLANSRLTAVSLPSGSSKAMLCVRISLHSSSYWSSLQREFLIKYVSSAITFQTSRKNIFLSSNLEIHFVLICSH